MRTPSLLTLDALSEFRISHYHARSDRPQSHPHFPTFEGREFPEDPE